MSTPINDDDAVASQRGAATTTTTEAQVPAADVEAFLGKVLADSSGFGITVLASLGDRLGLWKSLAVSGAVTSPEIASRAGVNERYTREWLHGMVTAGYVEHDPATDRFSLPAAHLPVLAEEGGLAFFGGVHQMLHGMVSVYDDLLDVFRDGGGVPQAAYHPDMWDGMDRFTAGWFENLLVQEWLPAMPEVDAMLGAGADVADVGCGRGRGLVQLAQHYPKSRFVGYDVFEPTVSAARANAEAAGVADRVHFEHRDCSLELPETFDVVFTFDVVHDAVDPRGLLRSIRHALRPDGAYVCLDINSSPRLDDNVGPLGAFFHSASVLYCMTTSLAHGGEGLGTCGFHEVRAAEYCAAAGFSRFRRVPLDNPFNNLYEARP